MKKIIFILGFFIFALFCSGSCKEKIDKYSITIKNSSDKEIIFGWSSHSSVAQDTTCLNGGTKSEYQGLIAGFMVRPYSNKKKGIDLFVESMQINPNKVLSIGIFYLEDIDAMSCEEFVQVYPLKKEWQVTLSDIMNAPDFNLVLGYTP
jgi:hypothetical protein